MSATEGVSEDEVLRVLRGASPREVADHAHITRDALAAAVAAYQAAGRLALSESPRWLQLRVRFTDWDDAERVMAHQFVSHLQRHTESATLTRWWFIRKHPNWRLRFLPAPGYSPADIHTVLAPTLDGLVEAGAVKRWWESRYEPEELLFGGPAGIVVAHDLFHADSTHLLRHRDRLRRPGRPDTADDADTAHSTNIDGDEATSVGRAELSVLLCSAMVRAARQDDGEHADVWHRVAQARAGTSTPARTDRVDAAACQLRVLVAADTSPGGALRGERGPLQFAASWIDAFALAGSRLADASRDGALTRGLRAVLADHVIFHWNRLGFPASDQAHLALAAREALLSTQPDP